VSRYLIVPGISERPTRRLSRDEIERAVAEVREVHERPTLRVPVAKKTASGMLDAAREPSKPKPG
jgi:hypothetical protein